MTEDKLYLIPTAEVPVTNVYRDTILKEDELPVKMTAYSPCFRREAGSYGKDVRGLNRVHQFEKVEIIQLVHPDKSYEVLDEMVAHVEALLNSLELPYRILRLCGGVAAAREAGLECWGRAGRRLEEGGVVDKATVSVVDTEAGWMGKGGWVCGVGAPHGGGGSRGNIGCI